jgi:hypothetical protein
MPDIRVDCERWWHNVALSRNDKSALTLRDLLSGFAMPKSTAWCDWPNHSQRGILVSSRNFGPI